MTELKTSRLIFCFLFLLMISAKAQAERLPIKTYTAADGLPRDHINRIVPDSKGFLWFCTSEGLSRFDDCGFVNYSVEQPRKPLCGLSLASKINPQYNKNREIV